MKKYKIKRIVAAAALASLTLLATACGSSNSAALPIITNSALTNPYGTTGSYGCISQPFGFVGTGIYMDNSNVYAGQLPTGGYYGQVQLSTPQGGGQYTNMTLPNGGQRALSDVALMFSVVGYGNIAGTFQISPARQVILAQEYNGMCPDAVSFEAGLLTGNGITTVFGGYMYLDFQGHVEQFQI